MHATASSGGLYAFANLARVEGKLLGMLGQKRYVQRVRVVSGSQKPGVESVLSRIIM